MERRFRVRSCTCIARRVRSGVSSREPTSLFCLPIRKFLVDESRLQTTDVSSDSIRNYITSPWLTEAETESPKINGNGVHVDSVESLSVNLRESRIE